MHMLKLSPVARIGGFILVPVLQILASPSWQSKSLMLHAPYSLVPLNMAQNSMHTLRLHPVLWPRDLFPVPAMETLKTGSRNTEPGGLLKHSLRYSGGGGADNLHSWSTRHHHKKYCWTIGPCFVLDRGHVVLEAGIVSKNKCHVAPYSAFETFSPSAWCEAMQSIFKCFNPFQ